MWVASEATWDLSCLLLMERNQAEGRNGTAVKCLEDRLVDMEFTAFPQEEAALKGKPLPCRRGE